VLESTSEVPEPHEFEVAIRVSHGDHAHSARGEFREGFAPRLAGAVGGGEGEEAEYQDAHERAHAMEIAQRFAGRSVSTPQIVLFGITGGLTPCPAALSVLLICLQLKRVAWGFTLVASFSVGLALTMVTTGVLAAWSVHHAQRRFRGFGEVMRRAPYFSSGVLVVIALWMASSGLRGLGWW
jgi:nickel/cobalt exporter